MEEIDKTPIKRYMALNFYEQDKKFWVNQRMAVERLKGL